MIASLVTWVIILGSVLVLPDCLASSAKRYVPRSVDATRKTKDSRIRNTRWSPNGSYPL